MPDRPDRFDVHVPEHGVPRIVANVAASIISAAIIGTFGILWMLNNKMTDVAAQQAALNQNFSEQRTDIRNIRKRVDELERTNGPEGTR